MTLEDVSGLFNELTFPSVEQYLSPSDCAKLQHTKYALIRRLEENKLLTLEAEAEKDHEVEQELERVMACLRLIRPMREELGPMRGRIKPDGILDITAFSHPYDTLNMSELERLFALRTEDAHLLSTIAPKMLIGMAGDYWKFRMSVHFYTDGFFASGNRKTRFFHRCTALESLFSSQRKSLRGGRYSKARIRYFLGESTAVYKNGDLPDHLSSTTDITVQKVLDPIYEARDTIAHGGRLDDSYFNEYWRVGLNGPLSKLEVLDESVSSLVRTSLIKILNENLLDHFASSEAADAYFGEVDKQEQLEAKAKSRS